MSKEIIRDLLKVLFIICVPIVLLVTALNFHKPILVGGFILGILIGMLRLYSFLSCMEVFLDLQGILRSSMVQMAKYFVSLIFCITIIAIALTRQVELGLYVVLGALLSSVVLTVYVFVNGIRGLRKN